MCESEKRQNWISAPRRKLPKARFDRNLTFMTIVRFPKAFQMRIDLCHKFYLTTTLCWRANAPRTTMMAARERAVRRSRRKRRRGGEEGEGGGEGGDGEEDGEEPQKVCSVITLSSSPYWCLLPILGRNKEPQPPASECSYQESSFWSLKHICRFVQKKWQPESVLGARLKTLNPCRHLNLRDGVSDYSPQFCFHNKNQPGLDVSGCFDNRPENWIYEKGDSKWEK